jgi:hypothetical protein
MSKRERMDAIPHPSRSSNRFAKIPPQAKRRTEGGMPAIQQP